MYSIGYRWNELFDWNILIICITAYFFLCLTYSFLKTQLSPLWFFMLKFPTKIINLDVSYQVLGEGNGTPLQYSCLENPMDGGAWDINIYIYIHTHTHPHTHTYWQPPTACGILVHEPGIKPMPLYWKCEVLITGPPGKPLSFMHFEE